MKKELGRIIKEKRKKKGLNAGNLVKKSQIDNHLLAELEKGEFLPDDGSFPRLARKVGLNEKEWDKFCLKWINGFLSKEEIRFIIAFSENDKVREKAWDKFLKYPLKYDDFTFLLDRFRRHEGTLSEKWQRIVSEEVLRRGFDNCKKIAILSLISSEKLLRKIGHNWNLEKPIMEEAQRKLLSQKGLRREAGMETGWRIL